MAQTTKRRRDLLLWRHAEAEAHQADDLGRRLTARGVQQAKSVAHWLRDHQPKRLRILVSPAVRARQTADAAGLDYEISPQLGPDATAADLIAAANWPAADGAVLLVGHQPTLGRLAALLLVNQEIDLSIGKGALWWFSREDDDETVLTAVIPAKLAD